MLDFGSRRLTIGFDEQVQPYVRDATNKRLASPPRAGARDDAEKAARDDAEKAARAHATWKTLKKDVRQVAQVQLARLEQAMCRGRRWKPDFFLETVAGNPLLRHPVRGLSGPCTTPRGHGARCSAWRRTEPWQTPRTAPGPCPPVTGGWESLFLLPASGWPALPGSRLNKLQQLGWSRGPGGEGGLVEWYQKPITGTNLQFHVYMDPGFTLGASQVWEAGQVVCEVDIHETGAHPWGVRRRGAPDPTTRMRMGEVSPVDFSEMVRDIHTLRA